MNPTSSAVRNALVGVLLSSSLARAQTGGGADGCFVGIGIDCAVVYGNEGAGPHQRTWLRAVVLWRRELVAASTMRDTAQWSRDLQRYFDLQIAAVDSGRTLLGSSGRAVDAPVAWNQGFLLGVPDTLRVLGRTFALPVRDSALVLMIDVSTSDATRWARLVGTTWIAPELDQTYWPRIWMSGDTTFTIRPRGRSHVLRDTLLASPTLRAFLGRVP